MPAAQADAGRFKLLTQARAASDSIDAMRDIVNARPRSQRVIALDTECDTTRSANGHVIGKKKDSLVQLAYMHSDNKIFTLAIKLNGPTLNARFLALLADPNITFVGSRVTEDLRKLGSDFHCVRSTNPARARAINLGMMAREASIIHLRYTMIDHQYSSKAVSKHSNTI